MQTNVKINGKEYTVTLDVSDYPETIIETVEDENGEVELSPDLMVDIYDAIAVDVASEMTNKAHEYAEGDR